MGRTHLKPQIMKTKKHTIYKRIFRIVRNDYTWDENIAHVIVAHSKEEVIQLAKKNCAAEKPEVWDNSKIEYFGRYDGKRIFPFIILTSNHSV
jgi:hypothetical protein